MPNEINRLSLITSGGCPNRQEAENLLKWGLEQNPGQWEYHCKNVARAAEAIAEKCGLDKNKAYALGLLHDFGYYSGPYSLGHVYAGYAAMTERGYNDVARICLSHSFPYQNFLAYTGHDDCTPEESAIVESTLMFEYDEYDRLIQLCDAIATAQGIILMDKRLMDVARRHGTNELTPKKWDAFYALKAHFDDICGMNIYDLFHDEIREVTFS